MQDFELRDFTTIANTTFEYRGDAESLNQSVAGISIDSRSIQPGEVYFALSGENHDGHEFLPQVFEKQASAAVVQESWWRENGSTYENRALLVVDDTIVALQEAAHAYRQKFELPVIGLTGTNGKTTTKEMVAAVLSQTGRVCKTQGNFNNHIGLPLTLFHLQDEHNFAVIEMGTNHLGEIARLCEIAQPGYGLITNIGHGHTEFLGGLEGVARAKMELFEYLQGNGVVFQNIDDAMIIDNAPALNRRITYGFTAKAEVHGTNLGLDKSGYPMMQVRGTKIRINLPGEHNLANALAAVAVGQEFGLDLEEIKLALENIEVPGKRMEVLQQGDLMILNDSYNANPESTLAALRTLKSMPANGKKIFAFGDMLELENPEAEHRKIGEALAGFGVDVLLAFGPLASEAVSGSGKPVVAKHFSNKQDLIDELVAHLTGDDILLVKGSRGMKMEDIITGLNIRS